MRSKLLAGQKKTVAKLKKLSPYLSATLISCIPLCYPAMGNPAPTGASLSSSAARNSRLLIQATWFSYSCQWESHGQKHLGCTGWNWIDSAKIAPGELLIPHSQLGNNRRIRRTDEMWPYSKEKELGEDLLQKKIQSIL